MYIGFLLASAILLLGAVYLYWLVRLFRVSASLAAKSLALSLGGGAVVYGGGLLLHVGGATLNMMAAIIALLVLLRQRPRSFRLGGGDREKMMAELQRTGTRLRVPQVE